MMRQSHDASSSTRQESRRGFVIVAVLWLLAALAALVTIFSVYLSNSARALALNDTGLKAEALVSAGIELAAYRLLLTNERTRPPRGSFHVRLSGAKLAVSYVTEAARVDLNAAPKELLAGLLSEFGASEDDAKTTADRIVAWRTHAAPNSAGNEDALYRAAGKSYSPRQAPFAHVNELALVLGMTPTLVERALPFVTVFNGTAGVDVLTAPPEVIAALPGMTPLILKDFLNTRETLPNDPAAITAALGAAGTKAAAMQKSKAYRILIRLRFPDRHETASEVVISLRGKEDPYQVLSWQSAAARG
ncbi:putative general secretory pathway protein K [Nitrobacter hamburgensis X14]|uniref:Putative general secretory pathway protein K n=1 Tax=Nitrobacter hamburgensis (strain DSM 10229 / NCIMB 13809 / X14) TaxID=323097 RepID=Q1QQ79_NITHX|nr:type II secretion system protein GspK [Nitrobacter hamburgensis]ABE61618.1 putative general secretory pathway protein K [Nitrobacter hamburgensis X14]